MSSVRFPNTTGTQHRNSKLRARKRIEILFWYIQMKVGRNISSSDLRFTALRVVLMNASLIQPRTDRSKHPMISIFICVTHRGTEAWGQARKGRCHALHYGWQGPRQTRQLPRSPDRRPRCAGAVPPTSYLSCRFDVRVYVREHTHLWRWKAIGFTS